jgi:hypothetical protein
MKLSLKIVGTHSGKPLGVREENARLTELANALKVVADSIANCGTKDGRIEFGDYRGSYVIEG